jgi:hypothetical protein
VLQAQHTVTELRLQLVQYESAASALEEVQKQLQAKGETLASVQQQLREEQRVRAAAEAAVRQAERALERAKTSLQDKLESERENLLVYGRSVHEVGCEHLLVGGVGGMSMVYHPCLCFELLSSNRAVPLHDRCCYRR